MLANQERRLLLDMARHSIAYGLEHGRAPTIETSALPDALRQPGASFVTLHLDGQLRGCIGSLQATRPLVEDVAENAFAAAFRDPRFAPVSAAEIDRLDIQVSVLSPPEAMRFDDEQDLLGKIEPGVDGLILEDNGHRGTFLPSVWESLPERRDFLHHLKQKAGLPADYWSDSLKVSRYRTESFSEHDA